MTLFITTCKLNTIEDAVGNQEVILDHSTGPTEQVYFCADDQKTLKTKEVGSQAFFKALRESGQKGELKHILLYVHGFNMSPFVVLDQTRELQKAINLMCGEPTLIVPIIWPCVKQGRTTAQYFTDRTSADMSAVAISRAISMFRRFMLDQWKQTSGSKNPLCGTSVHILAHSMGNRVLKEALHHYKTENHKSRLPTMFSTIFMKAADVTSDLFNANGKGKAISEAGRTVVVYHAKDDMALNASKVVNGLTDDALAPTSPRLGRTGPLGDLPQNVYSVDCDAINTIYDIPLGHTYFFDKKGDPSEVLFHITNIINTAHTPKEQKSRIRKRIKVFGVPVPWLL